MKKVLLFGTGAGSAYFIKNNKEFDIIGCLDNNKEKHGAYIEGVKIYPPQSIDKFDYDEIFIVTQWYKEVKEQLIKQLGVHESKIYIPPKNMLKEADYPFEDSQTIEFARKIICYLGSKALEESIPLYIDFGTLLGIIRDKDIILWDDDLDFSCPESHSKQLEKFLIEYVKYLDTNASWKIVKICNPLNETVGITIKFISSKYKIFNIDIYIKRHIEDITITLNGPWTTPSCYQNLPLNIIKWNNENILTPNNPEEYLESLYKDWKTPNKNSSFDIYNTKNDTIYLDFTKNRPIEKIIFEN